MLHAALLPRCWELRPNLTVYDAAYVAVAELTEATLLTADTHVASAPGPRCAIEVLSYPDHRVRALTAPALATVAQVLPP